MKVQNVRPGPQSLQSSSTSLNTLETDGFQRLLQNKIEASVKTQGIKAAAPADLKMPPNAALRLEGLSLTETTLATLDSYGLALESLSVSPQDLEPFVSALEEETAAIIDLKQELPPEDPLAKLLDRVATVSYLESVKYRRGDYAS